MRLKDEQLIEASRQLCWRERLRVAQSKARQHDNTPLDSLRAYRRLLQLAIQKTETVNVDKQNDHASMANKIPKTEFKSEIVSYMDDIKYPERIERMLDVMVCLPNNSWGFVLLERRKKIGTGALQRIISRAYQIEKASARPSKTILARS